MFNFGNTSTPAKPAFGNLTFGGGAATSTTFGTPATSAPAFGQTSTTSSFGQANQQSFGQPAGFGQPAQNTFGAPQQSTTFGGGFGATPATSAPTFGGFGTQTSTAPPAFGFGTATSASAAPAFGGFGGGITSQAQAPTSFNFGQTVQPTAGGFGTSTGSSNLFGGGFGAPNTSTQSGFGGFGTTFGKPAQSAPLFGGFSSSFGQQPAPFGQQQQPFQQAAPTLSPEEIFSQSIFNVSVFGDERDTTLARWNYLQAMWGTGKSFYSQNNPPVDIEPQNMLCRFKTMGYSKLPGKENKVGLVALKFNKTVGQVKDQQQQIINTLNQIFGNRPNFAINVDSIKALSETKAQLTLYVEERSQTSNETKRYSATETAQYLNQPMSKSQLGNLGVEDVLALVLPDEDQLKEYLEVTPKGIDPRMWKQAIDDNPNPSKFIPVPMIGFQELKWRITCQENETNTHLTYLAKVEKEISELKQRHANTSAKIMEHRRKFAELSHRILKIIVKQESTRKMGVSLSPEEEMIKTKLENMHALVSAPTQFKGRLSELLSQMRMQRNQWGSAGNNEYTLDKESSDEMKNFLTMQQKAMTLLIDTVNKDLKDLKVISEGMSRLVQA